MITGVVVFLLSLISGPASCAEIQLFNYEYKAFPTTITIQYQINKSKQQISMKMNAKVMGMEIGAMEELTVFDPDGELHLDSRCRHPKSNALSTTCYASSYQQQGFLLFKQFDGARAQILETMTDADQGVQRFNLDELFPGDAKLLEMHNPSSLFLLLLNPDFGLSYNGRQYYVTGNKQFFKVEFHITEMPGGLLDVRLLTHADRMILSKGEEFPGRVVVDPKNRQVTKLYLTVRGKEYIVSLKVPRSLM